MRPTSKYVLNLDELKDDLIKLFDELQQPQPKRNIEFSPNVKKIMNKIYKKVPDQNSIEDFLSYAKKLLDLFSNIKELKGDFCIDGQYKNIPAIVDDYEIVFKYNYDIYLTGLTFSQSGWKINDTWSLIVNDKAFFNTIFTKEVGEKKVFNTLLLIPKNTEIKFVLHNISGNSRQIWTDLEFIKE